MEPSKSLFKSKTFWLNVVALGLELSNLLPVAPGTIAVISNVANIAVRTITDTPVHLIPPEA